MRCPSCNHYFQQFASWRLALGKPLICPDCGASCRRKGRLMPLLIAVCVLVAFNQLIGMYAFTRVGMLALLAAMVLAAMWIDERTITLVASGGKVPPASAEPSAPGEEGFRKD